MSTPGTSNGADRIEVRHVDLYEATPKIHTRSTDGPLVRLRTRLRWTLIGALLIGPWLRWDGHQAILFDLPARHFNVFGLTFFPQDFILVSGALIVGAFALFTVTSWLGRVWCGYACPQSVWFQLFIDIESWIEGPRHRRIRQDAGPLTPAIAWMKARKWMLWLLVAVVTAVSIVGYFVPIRSLLTQLATLSVGGWALFWLGFFFTATLVMGALLREQVCKYMCPYARFQSAMFDPDTLIVSYDPARGEPRGSRGRNVDPRAEGLGDCIDCEICVQVCPVGIDIREGLQYECISCAHCIDGCDEVMERMGYAPGLISYTTEHRLENRPSRVLRPRLIGYGVLLLLMLIGFGTLGLSRSTAELDVIRDRGALWRDVIQGSASYTDNAYSLRIVNKSQQDRHWTLQVQAPFPVELLGPSAVDVPAGEVLELPVRLRAPDPAAAAPGAQVPTGNDEIRFRLLDGDREVAEKRSRFMSGGSGS